MNFGDLCRNCDNFIDDEPVRIIDKPASNPFSNDEVAHWDTAYKCTWNGLESLTIAGLHEGNCRCSVKKPLYTYGAVLNEAQDIVNEVIKAKYEAGEITSPYECGSWLDVIQIFDYTKEFWKDHLILSELDQLLLLIKIHNIDVEPAREALRLICSFILATETLYYWYGERQLRLLNRLRKYYPLNNHVLNYDYLRYVYNADINGANETEAVITS